MAHQPALLRSLSQLPVGAGAAERPGALALRSEEWLYQTRALGRLASGTQAVKKLLEKRYARVFAASQRGGIYFGVFDSFQAAAHAIPTSRPSGYDHPDAAEMYRDRLERVFPADYPVLFWLKELLPKVKRVFDLGGHVGIARYAYARYLDFTPDHDWTVYDLPAVVASGKRLADDKQMTGLGFTTSLSDASGSDLLFSSGALQYIEEELPAILGRLQNRPKWVLLNQVPLTDKSTYFTLQHITTSICPYAIRNRDTLIRQLEQLGYVVQDRWDNAEKSLHIPFHESHSLDHYEGLLLKLEGDVD